MRLANLVDPFYRRVRDYRNSYLVGQLFWAPIPYRMEQNAPILRVDHCAENNPRNCSYKIETVDLKTFDPRRDKPLYQLNLNSKEFALVVPHKRRKVVLISRQVLPESDHYGPYQKAGKESCVVVPLYTLKNANDEDKFSEEFVLKLQAYQYPSMFYLPEGQRFSVKESAARFDRVCSVSQTLLEPESVILSQEASFCLLYWLYHFLGAPLLPALKEYRELYWEAAQAYLDNKSR